MNKNPWNTIMNVKFDKMHKKHLIDFRDTIRNITIPREKKEAMLSFLPVESKKYLKDVYDSGYGFKVLARCLDISYTEIRTLFRYLGIDHRKGYDVVTDKVREFRSQRVRGNKNPWKDWTHTHLEMKNNSRGIQGYYKSKNNGLVWLRSSWEYTYAKWLDKNDIDWKYEEKQFKLSNGEQYRPDFFIYEDNMLKYIVEIKGYYKDRVNKTKILDKDLTDVDVIIISDMSKYLTQDYNREMEEWRFCRLGKKE